MLRRLSVTVVVILIAITLCVSFISFNAPTKQNDITNNDNNDNVAEQFAPPLVFNQNGEFKILHLTDFHEWMGIEKTIGISVQDTLKPLLESYLREIVNTIKPDLVVLGGDNVFSLSYIYDYLNGIAVNTYKRIAEIFEGLNQYWTLTFGNHDSESATDKYGYLDAIKDYPHFIGGVNSGKYFSSYVVKATEGESDYVSNFSIPVYSNDKTTIKYNLFILDSGSFDYVEKNKGYRSIRQEQVDWYASEVTKLNVPSVMFTHIPFPEMHDVYLAGEGIGSYTNISPSYEPSNMLNECVKQGCTRGIFFGHNHSNSYTGFYKSGESKIMMGVTPCAQALSY
ncbi:MAG: metallophosphoesterase, partial [Clostridia bacterium]|nr:metallophosphoesterase [Clostridia bacterium]